jgi:DNA-binding GntR family transcriptional regulator
MIVQLDLAPGSVVREDDLVERLGIGRTPVREAVQRLERDQLVTVLPRQGIVVTGVDVRELSTLFETRVVLEPYVHRLAAVRGTEQHWQNMDDALTHAARPGATWVDLMAADRACHEQVWAAADNRFLNQTLEMLYTQSERLWHLYSKDRSDLGAPMHEHRRVLEALRAGDGDRAAELIADHVRAFEAQTRAVLYDHLRSPLAGY